MQSNNLLDRAIDFYENSPDGQYDDVAALCINYVKNCVISQPQMTATEILLRRIAKKRGMELHG